MERDYQKKSVLNLSEEMPGDFLLYSEPKP